MQKNQILSFKPAVIKDGYRMEVVYSYLSPTSGKFERFRKVVPKIQGKNHRKNYASLMCQEINQKLYNGWNPFEEDCQKVYLGFNKSMELFLEQQEKEVTKETKRTDTLRSYKSFIAIMKRYNAIMEVNFLFEVQTSFLVKYLDHLYFEKNISECTYNNHLKFWRTFFNYYIQRGYITKNPCEKIEKKKEGAKKRKVFTAEIKQKVMMIQELDSNYFCLCMMTYYCFIRRTEITKLKVSDIHLQRGVIILDEKITKNRKTEMVTIPQPLIILLAEHIKTANNDDYLFSDNNFQTGKKILNPKKVTDTWYSYQNSLKIGREFVFYSLKDTGITDLLQAGVPAIKVRNQARHHDIKITESYTPRFEKKDDIIFNANFDFNQL